MADEPKIFIDEDWKARAQREKEELQKRAEAEAAARTAAPVVPSAPDSPSALAEGELPSELGPDDTGLGGEEIEGEEPYEANFDALLSSLATQTMFALGVIPQQDGGQVMINLDQAKFTIDILAMLHGKTKGNLTAEEQAMRQSGIDPNNLRTQ